MMIFTYLKRIFTLPFMLVVWVIGASIYWVRYGGDINLKTGKPPIDPEKLVKLLEEVNDKLDNLNREL